MYEYVRIDSVQYTVLCEVHFFFFYIINMRVTKS